MYCEHCSRRPRSTSLSFLSQYHQEDEVLIPVFFLEIAGEPSIMDTTLAGPWASLAQRLEIPGSSRPLALIRPLSLAKSNVDPEKVQQTLSILAGGQVIQVIYASPRNSGMREDQSVASRPFAAHAQLFREIMCTSEGLTSADSQPCGSHSKPRPTREPRRRVRDSRSSRLPWTRSTKHAATSSRAFMQTGSLPSEKKVVSDHPEEDLAWLKGQMAGSFW